MNILVWVNSSNVKEIPPFPVSVFPRTRNVTIKSIVRAVRTRSIVRQKFVRRININVTTINVFQVSGFATEIMIVEIIQVYTTRIFFFHFITFNDFRDFVLTKAYVTYNICMHNIAIKIYFSNIFLFIV